jgi:expansin (peptidoglycan-binding protein)
VLAIDWELVHCGLDSPLELVNQDGSSANWFSIQVQNHNLPIQSLEVSTDGGNTWKPTTRAYYNFFQEASGFGSNSVDVRVTSTTGKSIVVNNVQVASTASTTASANF